MRDPLTKHYFTRRETRALALDWPIGDPFGGPAYGEFREPITAAALFATVMEAAPIFTAVGAAMSVVGMVTGDKTLASIGAVMGLAGGVASFGSSAGWFGAAGDAVSADAATTVANQTADVAAEGAQVTPVADGQQSGIIQNSLDQAPATSAAPSPADTVKSQELGADGVGQGPNAPTTAPATTAAKPVAAAGTPEDWGMNNAGPGPGGGTTLSKAVGGAGGIGGDANSIWGKISQAGDWMAKNPMLTATAGAFIKGAFDGTTPAKIKQMQSQAGYYDAEATKLQQQAAYGNSVPNITGRLSVNTGTNVFAPRAAVPNTFGTGGIVNTARLPS